MSYKALIAGASGLVGGHCLRFLLEDDAYSKVISIGRRNLDVESRKLKQTIVDFNNLEEYAELFEVDHVFCCLGTTIKKAGSQEAFRKVDQEFPLKMAAMAAKNNTDVYSIVTALGASASSGIFYNKVKGEVENSLREFDIASVNILQPSLLMGNRKDSRMGERLAQSVMSVAGGLLLGPLKQYRGIDGEQVAKSMVKIAKDGKAGYHKFTSDRLQDM